MADTEASPYIDLDGLRHAVSALDRRYSASGHRHVTADVEGLDAALEGRAPLHHAHYMREVVGLTTALAGKADGSHAHSSLAAEPLEAGADLDALDMSRGDASVRLWSCYGGAAVDGAPDGETGAFALACELLRWADADDFASRQTYVSAAGREWQRYCASGEWTAWRKVYTSGDMPTPAEIGAADRVHVHAVSDVTGLRAALDGKAASSHTHNYAGSSSAGGAATSAAKVNVTTLTSQNLNDYRTPGTFFAAGGGNTCTNKPSGIDNFGMFVIQSAGGWQTQFLYGSNDVTYTRAYHGGAWTSWVEMYTSANKPTASEIGAAAASHTHSIANVSGLQAALDGKAASSHTHAASAITSGTLSADRLPTVPIAKGGTGATSASAARTALGITPANIGAAASSHSHPASQVTGLTASRALVSDSGGHPAVSAVTATELGCLDGVTSNVQTQLNGKAASSHSHSYLPLSGGTLTGAVTHNAKNNRYSCSGGSWINGKTATNVPIVFPTASTMDGSRYDPYMWGQNTDGDVWNFGAGANNQVGFFGFNSERTDNSSDWSVYMNITTGRLTSTSGFTGALSGNATTATTLQTARTINGTSFNGGANITTANWGTARTLTIGSTGKSVNGSGNVSWSLSEIGAAAANHTHSGYAPASHNHSAANITSGTLAVARGGTGVTSDDTLRQKVLNFPSNADLLEYLGL